MLQYFLELNKDGGRLKTPGYILFIALIVIILLLASALHSKKDSHKINTRELAFCSVCMALAFALSFVKLFDALTVTEEELKEQSQKSDEALTEV